MRRCPLLQIGLHRPTDLMRREMSLQTSSSMLPFLFVFLVTFSWAASTGSTHEDFLHCLYLSENSDPISSAIYTPKNASFASVLQSTIQNLRFNTSAFPKPLVIVTPLDVSHIQATITCSKKHGMEFRIRSGGHDYEGLSYLSPFPFVVLDLTNFRNISVDAEHKTAWVQSGATLGELYYRIAEKSRTLAFPAGACPPVGVGGHFGGGGYSFLSRKYGLAADNVIDAHLVDANGRVLDRASMGEDLFWAIRGGGGNTFGVVIAWKVNLVPVPTTVTVFNTLQQFDQNTTHIFNRWQHIADKLPDDITMFARVSTSGQAGNRTKLAGFLSLFLGGIDRLLPLMEERFPEMGLKRENCREMSWIESVLFLSGLPSNTSLDVLLSRNDTTFKIPFKGKSDLVKEPMPEIAVSRLLEWFSSDEIENLLLNLIPYGGKMSEIAEASLPYPHRAGNLYMINYFVSWQEPNDEATRKHIRWIRKVYRNMAPYVSKNPRAAYVNYKDLDIGRNNRVGNTSYKQASIWGTKYFKNNFDRLVRVKAAVDPSNFFRNEQTIPPLTAW